MSTNHFQDLPPMVPLMILTRRIKILILFTAPLMDSPVKHSTIFPFEMAFKVIMQRAEKWLQASVGCGRREMWVLLCVNDHQLSQRQIGEAIRLHPNVIVKILDGMEGKKLLRRARRINDRREHIVEATAKGKAALNKYLEERPEALKEVFAPLTEAQVALWREMSLRILQSTTATLNMGDS